MLYEVITDVARVQPMGPRLEDQKNELSRLLKRAATPLTVELVSDNQTIVSIYKVGQFGTFANRDAVLWHIRIMLVRWSISRQKKDMHSLMM